ncbi:MAG: type II toxin-antitoxin system RelB/DinJ family antitoxin [bacterium]|nr:type II toxin-antitoxin system RelB/DinJ family antitoxin [bacterium]MDE0501997.1 type II toxin-antitoxin system RelB/DinJ family antitoxin [bacterium]
MAKTATIRARVQPDLKHRVERLFAQLGLSTTEAITLFYRQVDLQQGLPFAVRLPNAETVEALQQAESGEGLTNWDNLEAMRTEFG